MVQVFFENYNDFLKNTLHHSKNMQLKIHQIYTQYARLKHYISIIYKVFVYLHIFYRKIYKGIIIICIRKREKKICKNTHLFS